MKYITTGILLISILLSAGCSPKKRAQQFPKDPPPGWTIVCDGQGRFGARFPDWIIDGKKVHATVIAGDIHNRELTNRQAAVDRAWLQFEYEWGRADKTAITPDEWQDCDSGVEKAEP